MKKLVMLVVVLAFGASASPAFGQATRTWVSGVGDDANPCSRTAPCKTFAGAISKTARDGIIEAMDDGGYGALTITKSITVDGAGHLAGLLASGGINALNINIDPTADPEQRVVLRGLDIEGNGSTLGLNGINVSGFGAKSIQLEDVQIGDFSRNGINVTPGASFPPLLTMLLDNVTVYDNGPGGPNVGPDGIRIRPSDASHPVNALIRNSVFKGHHPAPGDVAAGETGIGVSADTGAHVWLTNTSIFDNQIGVKTFNRQGGTAGIIDSFCDNQVGGNVDNGVFTNEMCPEPTAGPAPPPQVITNTVTIKQCVVPSLKGLPLSFAKKLLSAANCRLGTVTKKKARKRSQIGKVMSQKIRARTTLAEGSKVGVTVGKR